MEVNKLVFSKIQEEVEKQENLKLREGSLELWREDKLTDLTLQTIEDQKFSVHKYMVSIFCPYFQGMFNSNDFVESNQKIIKLDENIKGAELKLVLEYIYTGRTDFIINLEWEQTLRLQKLAYYLCMDVLKKLIDKYLIITISHESCLGLWRTSDEQKNDYLQIESENYIKENVNGFVRTNQSELNATEIIKILAFDELNCNDSELYLNFITWIKIDFNDRQIYIKDIFERINFKELSVQFIKDNILDDEVLYENKYFIKVIIKEIYSRIKSLEPEIIFGMDTSQNPLLITNSSFSEIDMKNEKISILRKITKPNGFSCIKFDDKKIFFSGGEKSNRCEYFENDQFHSLPSMSQSRWYHGSVLSDNKIYCCGGYNNKTTEIFDLTSMKWMQGAAMNCAVWNFGLIRKDSILYAVNAESITNKNDYILQRYDARIDSWETLYEPSTVSGIRIRTKACQLNDKIYVNGSYEFYNLNIENNSLDRLARNLSNINPFSQLFKYENELCIFGKNKKSNKFQCFKLNETTKKIEDYLNFPEFNYEGDDIIHLF